MQVGSKQQRVDLHWMSSQGFLLISGQNDIEHCQERGPLHKSIGIPHHDLASGNPAKAHHKHPSGGGFEIRDPIANEDGGLAVGQHLPTYERLTL